MKNKTSKQFSTTTQSADMVKVAVAALLVTILLVGAGNLFSLLVSKVIN